MKILITMTLALGVLLAACGDDSKSSASKTPSGQATVASGGVKPAQSAAAQPTPGAAQPTTAAAQPTTAAAPLSDGNAPGIPELKGDIASTPSGLRYVDQKVGDGASPKPTDNVTVHYTGWTTDGYAHDILTAAASVAAFALQPSSADCALIFDAQPGDYTIQISGMNASTGVALVEIYVLP